MSPYIRKVFKLVNYHFFWAKFREDFFVFDTYQRKMISNEYMYLSTAVNTNKTKVTLAVINQKKRLFQTIRHRLCSRHVLKTLVFWLMLPENSILTAKLFLNILCFETTRTHGFGFEINIPSIYCLIFFL